MYPTCIGASPSFPPRILRSSKEVVATKHRQLIETCRYYDSLGGENRTCVDLLESELREAVWDRGCKTLLSGYMQDEGACRNIEKFQTSWKKIFRGPPHVCRTQRSCPHLTVVAGARAEGWVRVRSLCLCLRRLHQRRERRQKLSTEERLEH
eukprot:750078-Hanusia_phi.AAC.3